MFDMTSLVPRQFALKLPNGLELNVNPPKIKVLKKMMALSKDIKVDKGSDDGFSDSSLQALTESLSMALSSNKQKHKVTADELNETLDLVQMLELFTQYFDWVGEINESKN